MRHTRGMLLTQLEYFVALARERHFGRVAAACHVTQSALSEAIRKLETELGTPLIQRRRSFEGLTPEGERVLVWARKIVDDHRALVDEVSGASAGLSGEIRLGVIPSATTVAADLLGVLGSAHPDLRARCVTSLSSEQIIDRIHRFELDAGLIHPSVAERDSVLLTPVGDERLVVVGSADVLAGEGPILAAELAELPLCLLDVSMRGRQVLDRQLERHGVRLTPRIVTDSVESLLALARTGRWATVVPASAVGGLVHPRLRIRELIEPEVTLSIVLAVRAEDPQPPATRAILAAVRRRARSATG